MTDNTIADLQATVAEAHSEYAHQNGDGFYQPDWLGANEYRDEGINIGEEAFKLAADERGDFIEEQAEQHPASARYLISWAAKLQIAELEREAKLLSEGFVYYRGMKMTVEQAEAAKARDNALMTTIQDIVGTR